MTKEYDVDVLSALASKLLQKSNVSERVENDLILEYCMSGEVLDGSNSDISCRG